MKALKQHGWKVVRVKGSHFMMEKNGLVVPVPCHNWDMGIGLLKEISRKTGVSLP